MEDEEVVVAEPVAAETTPVASAESTSEYDHLCVLLADIYERMERIESHLDAASQDNPAQSAETQIEDAKNEVEQEKTTIEATSSDYPRTPKRVTFLW